MASSKFHKEKLAIYCRICSGKLGRVSYNCSKYQQLLLDCLPVNVEGDKSEIHPPKLCNTCYATLRKMQAALDSGTEYRRSLEPFAWAQHSEMGCTSCQHFEVQMKGGGQNNKRVVLAVHSRAL